MKKKLIGFLIFAILISGQGEVVPVLAVDSDVSQFNSENETENTGTIVTDSLPQDADSYLIADSATRVISADEVGSFDRNLLKMSIKEIYARRGVKFADADIQAYFSNKSWYV